MEVSQANNQKIVLAGSRTSQRSDTNYTVRLRLQSNSENVQDTYHEMEIRLEEQRARHDCHSFKEVETRCCG